MKLDVRTLTLLWKMQNPLEGNKLEYRQKQINIYLDGVFYSSQSEMDYGLLQVVYLAYQAMIHNSQAGQEQEIRFDRDFLVLFLNLAYARYFGLLDHSRGQETMARIESRLPQELTLEDMQYIY